MMVRSLFIFLLASALLSACDALPPVPDAPDCSWVNTGTLPPIMTGKACRNDPKSCAVALNQCLIDTNFADNTQWWLFTSDKGLEQNARNPRHINHQTPQHGRWLSVYVNSTAHEALQKVLDMPTAPEDVELPPGSIIAKLNYSGPDALPAPPWLTVMAKIDGYCTDKFRKTHGNNCNGGDWFYYLSRFGALLSFAEIVGSEGDGTPSAAGREPAFGQPSSFCTDCHNPVERTDFLWTLDAALWKTQPTEMASAQPAARTGQPTPADLCNDPKMTLSPDLPPDVPLDPGQITVREDAQAMFDCFSWKSFIALNWVADSRTRGQPDKQTVFADLAGERVWESYKETFEVFQPGDPKWQVKPEDWGNRQAVPEACKAVIDALGLATRDSLKTLQMVTKTRSNQVLNETHQAFGNQFNILVDQLGRLVRYEVRFNQDEFQYLAENGYADTGRYTYSGPNDVTDFFFPTNANGKTGAGSIEVKAAWRQMCETDTCTVAELEAAKRYYAKRALKYTPKIGETPAQCSLMPSVGLIGLHVIRKTETAPQWVWSTFEHIDNVPDAGAAPRRDNYTLYNSDCALPENSPSEQSCASQRPGILPPHKRPGLSSQRAHCCANLQLIRNTEPNIIAAALGTKPPAAQRTHSAPLLRNHVTRLDPIGPQAMNVRMAALMKGTPFANYVLVNTQWPKDARNPQTGAVRKLSCFQTGVVNRKEAPCYKILPRKGNDSLRLRNTSMETFQVSIEDGPGAAHFSSAGCINCHGDAGVDFSFVFTDGVEITAPEKE